MIYHVHFTCAPNYLTRRLPFRPAHLEQLAALRARGLVVAGGPEPGGIAANIFYRVADRATLERLLEQNVFNRAGLFTAHHPRQFAEFLAPTDLPALDAGLAATIVEGAVNDRGKALAGLAALQRDGRAALGGVFDGDVALAVLRSADADEAIGWLADSGGWEPTALQGRAWSQTL
jgi:uncharacterized protein